MDRLKRLSIVLLASLALTGCAEKQETKEWIITKENIF